MMRAVEISKHATTIGELVNLPNSYSHTLFKMWRDREEYLKMHPKEADQQAQADALREGLMGG
jgi:hypothetical protein